MTNEERKQVARWALATFRLNHRDYFNHPEEPDHQAIVDLIANLLHLDKELGGDPVMTLTLARNHYEAEA